MQAIRGIVCRVLGAFMDRKTRDFYHIQDKVDLCWRYADSGGRSNVPAIHDIEKQIAVLTIDLEPLSSPINQLLDLYDQKIAVLQGLLNTRQGPGGEDHENIERRLETDVTLSSSGMGFFSEKSAEEYSIIEIDMYLETTECEVMLRGTIMECRVSADSENPGNWLRVRFEKGQEKEADAILAHVTNRQIEKLKRQESARLET